MCSSGRNRPGTTPVLGLKAYKFPRKMERTSKFLDLFLKRKKILFLGFEIW